MDDIQKKRLMDKMTVNLPTLRAKANLTQAKLSEMIGVSRQTIVAIESQKRKMSWNTFLLCLLVFKNNEETDQLLRLYEISTNELTLYLSGNDKGDGEQCQAE